MKVTLVCPYSLTLPGGVQGQVLGLAAALRGLGIDATVVAPCDDEPPSPGVIAVGRSIPLASNGSVAPIAPDPAAVARTVAALRSERPDVVHVHEPISPGPSLAAVLAARVPVVGTFHASGAAPAALYRAFGPVVRAIARRLAVRTAVSEDARALAERWMRGTYRILPNGVDVEQFSSAAPWADRRGGRPAVLFIGRHEERKGLGVLLDAFTDLDRDAVLWVAGEGPQTAELAGRGVPNVEWLGPISEAEKAQRLRAASVFCAPSLYGESFGIVLLEAMAAGVPVIASDIAGYRDVARQGREAILTEAGDPGALRGALRRVLDEPACAEAFVAAAVERAASYSMPALAERYLTIYEQVLERADR